MVLRGELAELMVKVIPSMYRKYVTSDKKGHRDRYGVHGTAFLFCCHCVDLVGGLSWLERPPAGAESYIH